MREGRDIEECRIKIERYQLKIRDAESLNWFKMIKIRKSSLIPNNWRFKKSNLENLKFKQTSDNPK